MGFTEATPIQAQTIPLALQGYDVLGQAQTGTGKTAAFGIPLIETASLEEEQIQSLVITPTRELAIQVAEELNRIGAAKGIRSIPIYGGQDINRQIRSLKKRPQIIVGTPGRLQDHIQRRTIRLQGIQQVVLDEADEMLQMGFREEIEAILSRIPSERQVLLFSATMPNDIRALAKKFMNDPKEVKIKAKSLTIANIKQAYIEVTPRQKFDALCNLIDFQRPELAIVFGRTRRRVDELVEGLSKRGYSVEGLHGDYSQAHRDRVIKSLREGRIDIMVATDVAARGLDISNISHIYNFDLTHDAEIYVHRIGRTGRAGKEGTSVTFVTPKERDDLRNIERVIKKKMKKIQVPSAKEVTVGHQLFAVNELINVAKNKQHHQFIDLAEKLLEENDAVTLLSAALKMITKETDQTPVQISHDSGLRKRSSNNKRSSDNRRKGKRNFSSSRRQQRRNKAYS
ncbi:DEAD/DEAH box helicase [Seinonella peptonophila]|nr:DEAD/DEAH box helicase [Seinonella peptonophila]